MSRGAVAANIALAIAGHTGPGPLLGDARADAWGHGAAEIIAALQAAGVREVVVDSSAIAALIEAGCTGLTVSGEPNVDPLTVFGLPGGAAGSRPALRLSGRVLSTKPLLRGEGVSYGYLHRAGADTRIALVTGGYAQGISRSLGGLASVAIGGVRHPIVGRVAMDVCVVDIAAADIARGAEAVFLGDHEAGEPGIADWVTATGLSAAELVTVVGQRSVREWVE